MGKGKLQVLAGQVSTEKEGDEPHRTADGNHAHLHKAKGGLVGLDADRDFRICISRQANDPDAIQTLINKTGRLILPQRQVEQPRREFVRWHWENCFKH